MPAWCNDPLCESTVLLRSRHACSKAGQGHAVQHAARGCKPCPGMRTVRRDGRMDAAGPAPCAAVQVTTLVVEDLFYNMLTRKKASLLAPSQP